MSSSAHTTRSMILARNKSVLPQPCHERTRFGQTGSKFCEWLLFVSAVLHGFMDNSRCVDSDLLVCLCSGKLHVVLF